VVEPLRVVALPVCALAVVWLILTCATVCEVEPWRGGWLVAVHDAATFPGIVLTCRVIGILQIEQKSKGKAERNDRLFAVPRRSHSEQGLRDVRDLSKPIQQELEKFFIATDELEDKKLKVIGWKGPKIAMKAIKDSAKSFSKDG
jgi:inorganic pyrophosphatase